MAWAELILSNRIMQVLYCPSTSRTDGRCVPGSPLFRWYHLASTCDGKMQSLYIDGVLQQSMPSRLELHPEEPLYIGRKGSDEAQFNFKGLIDDVRIYDRALSASEVGGLSAER